MTGPGSSLGSGPHWTPRSTRPITCSRLAVMLSSVHFLTSRRAFFAGFGLALSLLSAPSGALGSALAADRLDSENPAADAEDDGDGTRPGLLALYRSLNDPQATLLRIDAKPA